MLQCYKVLAIKVDNSKYMNKTAIHTRKHVYTYIYICIGTFVVTL